MKKANHICKYSKCTLGADGGRKELEVIAYCSNYLTITLSTI